MATTANAINVNGTTLFYEETGQGEPIVFIHGMCGDAGTWSDQMRQLSTQFHCIAYDRRGHSRSPLGQIDQRSVERHADDAAQLIMEIGLHPCTLVGSSSGARIALDVVRRYPDLLKGAVLSEPPLMPLDPVTGKPFVEKIKSAVDSAVALGGRRAGVDAFFELVCPGFWPSLAEDRREALRANVDEMFGDLMMPPYAISKTDLAEVRVPCLIVSGSDSDPMFRSVSRILAETIPGARLIELEGSGHVTYAEKPAEFAAAVAAFATKR